jgi:ABC-type branched-subunit amino acid transport system ATPase component/branched-subunit amino acid ABC-type transport system permease component
MKDFLQFALIGLGLGSAYALFAMGTVLIYRGSGIVNFGQGGLGALAAYITFGTVYSDYDVPIGVALLAGILASIVAALAFEFLVLRQLKHAAPIVRLISTLGLLAVLQAALELHYGRANLAVQAWLPHETFDWGGVRVQEQVLYIIGVTVVMTAGLYAFTRYSRIGLALTAAAQNERAVQTLGWSPTFLSRFTWGLGAGLAGIAGVLVAPSTGLSTVGFTLIVTVAALAAALLGGFRSFPLTLLGGMVIGIGESMVTLYRGNIEDFFHQDSITGMNRAVPFLAILLVLVVRGRGLPLRSHVTDRLPKLGTGIINFRALTVATVVVLIFLFGVFDERWAAATYISLGSAVVVLSVIVLTGYAGQVSLGQMAVAGLGALFAGSLIDRAGWGMEISILVGILLTIPAGLIFALPALRTRGVNLAVVTLGLGFTISEVVFANGKWIGHGITGGTNIGNAKLFGIQVDAATHPHRWAFVCLIGFVLCGLLVANLRRSQTGRRLIAVRTNERAAASLGISVFSVKLYAFGVASFIAAVGGVLLGFQSSIITYDRFNVFASINAVGYGVIGGVGFVLGAAFSAPNAIGGLGTRIIEDLLSIGDWDALVGGVLLLLIIVTHQDGVAEVAVHNGKALWSKLKLAGRDPVPTVLGAIPDAGSQRAEPKVLGVDGLTVRFGGVVAVNNVSFTVNPGEVVGLIGPNGAGKTTVIDAVTGFVRPAAGTFTLANDRIEGWAAAKRARSGLRRSFQSLELFDDATVEDNIRAGADMATPISWVTDLFWPQQQALPAAAVTAIHEFALEPDLTQLPESLSYGKRRLVGIARAVASGPSIIMLDEPAAGLDEFESRELAHLIRRLADERGMGVLLVEHDVGLVMSTCDRIVVLEFGKVIASGTPDEIREDPAVVAAYLGDYAGEQETVDVDSVDVGAETVLG